MLRFQYVSRRETLLTISNVLVVDVHNRLHGIPDCTQVAEDEKGTQVPKGCKRKIECNEGEYVVEDPGFIW